MNHQIEYLRHSIMNLNKRSENNQIDPGEYDSQMAKLTAELKTAMEPIEKARKNIRQMRAASLEFQAPDYAKPYRKLDASDIEFPLCHREASRLLSGDQYKPALYLHGDCDYDWLEIAAVMATKDAIWSGVWDTEDGDGSVEIVGSEVAQDILDSYRGHTKSQAIVEVAAKGFLIITDFADHEMSASYATALLEVFQIREDEPTIMTSSLSLVEILKQYADKKAFDSIAELISLMDKWMTQLEFSPQNENEIRNRPPGEDEIDF